MTCTTTGMSKDTGGIARQVALGLVQSGCGKSLDFEVFPGYVSEASSRLPMLERCLARFPLKRVVLVADRGMLSLKQIEQLQAMRLPKDVSLSLILAVPARRYGEFMDPVVAMAEGFDRPDAPWVAETASGENRVVVAHDPQVAAELKASGPAQIAAIEAEAQRRADKLDAQDQRKRSRGRPATDRGAYLRFVEAVKEAGPAQMSRVLE